MTVSFKADGATINAKQLPDQCPWCFYSVLPIWQHGIMNKDLRTNDRFLQIVFECPRPECFRIFVADYRQVNRGPNEWYEASIVDIWPVKQRPPIFPEIVTATSPSFCKIFTEAAAAESFSLKDCAGPAYRKALEFLIKDFLISSCATDDEKQTIREMQLMNCISNKITSEEIKQCATRATWLGNDETHYSRIWTNHDLEDLKLLIKLTQNWIENVMLTRKYAAEMTKP